MTGTAVAKKPEDTWRGQLQAMEPQFGRALPPQVPVERFVRATETAIMKDGGLLDCDRRSLFQAVMQCAETGLMPNGRDAALVRYKSQVQFIPMIGGILRLMRNTGEIASIVAEAVCENDDFDYSLGSDPHIHHKPPLNDRGEVIGAYACVKTKDGAEYIEVMGIADIKKIQGMSRAKSGPWQSWYEEMVRKTVLRRLAKKCPLSTDKLIDLTSKDDHMYDLTAVKPVPTKAQEMHALLKGEDLANDDDSAPDSPVEEQQDVTDVEAEDAETGDADAPEADDAGTETETTNEEPELLPDAAFESAQEAMDDIATHIRDAKTDNTDDLIERYDGWKALVIASFKEPKEIDMAGRRLVNQKRLEIEKGMA